MIDLDFFLIFEKSDLVVVRARELTVSCQNIRIQTNPVLLNQIELLLLLNNMGLI